MLPLRRLPRPGALWLRIFPSSPFPSSSLPSSFLPSFTLAGASWARERRRCVHSSAHASTSASPSGTAFIPRISDISADDYDVSSSILSLNTDKFQKIWDAVELNPELERVILTFAEKPINPVTVAMMYRHGSNLSPTSNLLSVQFLHSEIPIRFAKRIKYLRDLPFGLSKDPSVETITTQYVKSFGLAVNAKKPLTQGEGNEFTELVKFILNKHATLRDTSKKQIDGTKRENFLGVLTHYVTDTPATPLENENSTQYPVESTSTSSLTTKTSTTVPSPAAAQYKAIRREHFLLQEFMDRFQISRLSTRLLLAQHVALQQEKEGFVGLIEKKCFPKLLVQQVAKEVAANLAAVFGVVPPEVIVKDVGDKVGKPAHLLFVRSHLRFISTELLRNAMTAVIVNCKEKKKGSTSATPVFPAIHVVIAEAGDGEVVVKISDRGGGIRKGEMEAIWTYSYSTSQDACGEKPGMGLPTSRLLARYLGGDLKLFSMHGYGTDAFLYLKHQLKPTNDDDVDDDD